MVTRYHLQLAVHWTGDMTGRTSSPEWQKAAKEPLVSAPRWVKGSNGGGREQDRAGNNFLSEKGAGL